MLSYLNINITERCGVGPTNARSVHVVLDFFFLLTFFCIKTKESKNIKKSPSLPHRQEL